MILSKFIKSVYIKCFLSIRFHDVATEENSVLASLFGKRFTVNSFHRDCAESVGSEMRVTARSDDGMIEAIEHRTLPVYGFQFHPERMRGGRDKPVSAPDTTALFRFFTEKCLTEKE